MRSRRARISCSAKLASSGLQQLRVGVGELLPQPLLRLFRQVDLVGERVAAGDRAVDRDQPGDAGGQQAEAEHRLDRPEDPQQRRRRRDVAVAEAGEVDEGDVEGVEEPGVRGRVERRVEVEPCGQLRPEDQRPAHRQQRRPGADDGDVAERARQQARASRCAGSAAPAGDPRTTLRAIIPRPSGWKRTSKMSRRAIPTRATPRTVQTMIHGGEAIRRRRRRERAPRWPRPTTSASSRADLRPGVAVDRLLARALAAAAAVGLVVDRGDHRRARAAGSSGSTSQPVVRVVDDRGRAAAVDGDHRQAAGHRLDQDLAELLARPRRGRGGRRRGGTAAARRGRASRRGRRRGRRCARSPRRVLALPLARDGRRSGPAPRARRSAAAAGRRLRSGAAAA